MSPTGSCGGASTRGGAVWGKSPPPRPGVVPTPRRRVSISLADFSGNAATRFARPIWCSLSRGPSARMKAAPESEMCFRSIARIARSVTIASQPSAPSPIALAFRPRRARNEIMLGAPRPSKTDDNLSKYLPTFEPRKAALELSQRHLGIDHRQQASRHFGEAFADVAHRGAERADDAILLL